jgi:hypothetical protein
MPKAVLAIQLYLILSLDALLPAYFLIVGNGPLSFHLHPEVKRPKLA